MERRTFLSRSLLLLGATAFTASLAGCGFQLRGTQRQALGIDRLALVAPPSPLTDQVRRELDNAEVSITDDAPLQLNLGNENVETISLRGGDMVSDEIELHMTVPFSVQRRSDNAYLVDQGRLESTTTYLVNNDDPLVRDEIQESSLAELRSDITRQLMAQLRSLEP